MVGPDVTATSAIVMDAGSGRILWGKNIDIPRFPASTTKVMTALLLLERTKPTDVIVAPPGIEKVDPSSMHLRAGEKVSAQEMLYAMMLRSANDGSVAVAQHIAGSVSGFAELMNKRALELGCQHTHFENPNGLNNPRHVTTARDLAIIAREAMQHPEFRDVVKLSRHKIKRSLNQRDLWMVSKNKLILKDKTFDGIKTGWTVPAGHCYIGSTYRNGFRLITVVLKSKSWQADEEELAGWGFSHFEPVFLDGDKAPKAIVTLASGGSATVAAPGPVYALVAKNTSHDVAVSLELIPSLQGHGPLVLGGVVQPGQVVGNFVIGTGDAAFKVPAIVQYSSGLANASAGIWRGNSHWTTLFAGLGLAGGALLLRRKSRLVRGFGTS